MKTICDEFEACGCRRVDAELRYRGIVVNTKKIRQLMRAHAQSKTAQAVYRDDRWRSRLSDLPDLMKTMTQADYYLGSRHHLCRNLDSICWRSHCCLVPTGHGIYAINRSDARLAVAALKACINARDPQGDACIIPTSVDHNMPPKTIAWSCRARSHRLQQARRSNLRQCQGESFMKTLKVEAVYRWPTKSLRPFTAIFPLHR